LRRPLPIQSSNHAANGTMSGFSHIALTRTSWRSA
jgi:hypothetical protein